MLVIIKNVCINKSPGNQITRIHFPKVKIRKNFKLKSITSFHGYIIAKSMMAFTVICVCYFLVM